MGQGKQPLALRSHYETQDSPSQCNQNENSADQKQILESVETSSDQSQAAMETEPHPPGQPTEQSLTQDKSSSGAESDSPLLQWRDGESHPKAKRLLLRYATVLDVKERGAARKSTYYRKHGKPGLPSPSLSRGEGGREEETAPKEDLR